MSIEIGPHEGEINSDNPEQKRPFRPIARLLESLQVFVASQEGEITEFNRQVSHHKEPHEKIS